MSRGKSSEALEAKIGYSFKNRTLLETALTHSSYANECRARKQEAECNERLEFLGDAVLQIYISDYLFSVYPDCAEGVLTQMRQFLVCETTLAQLAEQISLGDFLSLGKGEEACGGRKRPSVLSDAFEALLAAIYLDGASVEKKADTTNNKKAVRAFLLSVMKDKIKQAESAHIDYKTRLQQLVQQDGEEQLSYETIDESGPAHERIFTVEAKINSNKVGCGKGHTKREAEQNAAREALMLFGVRDEAKYK